jgi:hypothetical protein
MVTGLVRMFEDVQKSAGLNADHDILEGNAAIEEELRVLLRTPSERLHPRSLADSCVPIVCTRRGLDLRRLT